MYDAKWLRVIVAYYSMYGAKTPTCNCSLLFNVWCKDGYVQLQLIIQCMAQRWLRVIVAFYSMYDAKMDTCNCSLLFNVWCQDGYVLL